MAKILFGFGGVKFSYPGLSDAIFSGGIGNIIYKPIQLKTENINRNIVSRLLGYRVELKIDELLNIQDDDYIQYQRLSRILGGLTSATSQRTVTITPRNDDTLINSLTYECILDSDFAPEDLNRLKIGQVVNLKFTCINLKSTIPTTISDTGVTNWKFNTDNAIFNTDNAAVQIN